MANYFCNRLHVFYFVTVFSSYSAVAAVGAAAFFTDVLTDVFTGVFTDVFTDVFPDVVTGAFTGAFADVFTGVFTDVFTGVFTDVFIVVFADVVPNPGRSLFEKCSKSCFDTGTGM